MLLEPIYEADFLPCSYGFRPGQSAHNALASVRAGVMDDGHRWVIDGDIKKYYDTISHRHLRSFLDLRITDGVIRRMIDKWLSAGVLEEGTLRRSDTGTPQGGVVSPTLSNIFLHHVLDDWFEHEAKPRLRGRCQLVRYADDIVLAFEDRRSAERLLDVLGKRLGRYGLELHETKTRLVDFRPNCPRGHDHETVFDFLGLAHIWGTSRRGNRVVRQITAKSRLARAVKTVYEWCKNNRHQPLSDQQAHLAQAIRGHCAYYGLTGNSKSVAVFRHEVARSWRKAPVAPKPHRTGELATDERSPCSLPPASSQGHAINLRAVSETDMRRTECVNAHARVCEGRGSVTTPPTRPLGESQFAIVSESGAYLVEYFYVPYNEDDGKILARGEVPGKDIALVQLNSEMDMTGFSVMYPEFASESDVRKKNGSNICGLWLDRRRRRFGESGKIGRIQLVG